MITAEDIYLATDGGKAVILNYYPQAAAGFSGRRNFKLRPDDKNPSGTVFLSSDGHWLLQDKGGGDNQAYNAISLVQREERLTFPQAIEWIASKFAPHLLERPGAPDAEAALPKPVMTEVPAVDRIEVNCRPDGRFTDAELERLGYNITPKVCEDLCLKPVDSYVTVKNAKGKSFRVASTPEYPIYYYDYGLYGRIYCPLGGKLRFQWKDKRRVDDEDTAAIEKVEKENRALKKAGKDAKALPVRRVLPFSGEREFMTRYQGILDGSWSPTVELTDEDGNSEETDLTWDKLIICSGGSDALNVHNAGYHVCWPNSETAAFTEHQYNILSKMAKKIYILYDIDDTGIRQMYDIALRFLDISIIRLPEELKRFRSPSGKPCKDAKDFFTKFRRPENQDPVRMFNELVKLSGGLKFWTGSLQRNGSWKYDINNDQLYSFLEASGFYTIATTSKAEGFTFCRIRDNVVTLIDKEAIAAECVNHLLEYLRTHPEYYSQALVNTIHRSKQITAAGLQRLRRIEPDFNAFTPDYDYFFFRNGIFRVGKAGIEKVKPSDCPYAVYDSKIIDHDFVPEKEPYFDIAPTKGYGELASQLSRLHPSTPQWLALSKKIDTIDEIDRYRLNVRKWGSTFMQYVYNTGRVYWRKEEEGQPLTQLEQLEVQQHFIAKSLALGYMLSKHKNSGQPWAVYAMEVEQAENDEHLGGTGKSLFCSAIERMRCQFYIDAQRMREDKMQFFLSGVVRGMTDTIFMDDLNRNIDLHIFMNMVTGKMTVDVKHANPFTLDFLESPKLCWTSNHAIRGFDDSLNRRIWFAAFSDYYHSTSPARKLVLRSPRTEFGKDLIDQYTPDEMNCFYNYLFNCIQMWHKIHERVQPPMKAILQRTLLKSMTESFFYWAEEWFTAERLDRLVDQDEAYDAYKSQLSKRSADFMNMKNFRDKLQEYCLYHGWVFNPDDIYTSASDRKAKRVHKKVDGEDHYYFYIDTTDNPVAPDLPQAPEGAAGVPAEELTDDADKPIFG